MKVMRFNPILVFLFFFATQKVIAQGLFEDPAFVNGNTLLPKTAIELSQKVHQWLKENTPKNGTIQKLIENPQKKKALISFINAELKKLNRPLIDENSPHLQIYVPLIRGFADSSELGVAVLDGKNRFCFPCQEFRNSQEWGISAFPLTPEDPTGKYYKVFGCLQATSGWKSSSARFSSKYNEPEAMASFLGKRAGKEGFYLLTQSSLSFYDVEAVKGKMPGAIIYGATSPKGNKTAVILRADMDTGKWDEADINHPSLKMKNLKDAGRGSGPVGEDSDHNVLMELIAQQSAELVEPTPGKYGIKSEKRKQSEICSALQTCIDALNESPTVVPAKDNTQETLKTLAKKANCDKLNSESSGEKKH